MTGLGPDCPGNWYLIGPSSALKPGQVVTQSIGETALIVYRGKAADEAHAFAARCAHMGCHLGGARVVGDALRCPLHHRIISPDGFFGGDRGDGLRQRRYPVRDYLGCLFVYVGGPSANEPELDPVDPNGFSTCFAGEHSFPLDWQALVANGFDVEHLASVHERRLLEPPILEQVSPTGMQLRYRTRPTGMSLADRVIARLAPDGLNGSIKCFSGTMMLVETTLGKRRSFILLSFNPGASGGTTIRGIVGVASRSRLWGAVSAHVAAALFKGFLAKDLGVLENLEWHEPAALRTTGDRFTRALCDHFRQLHA